MIIFEQTLKTRSGSKIKRSKWGVGKDIGGSLYVHISYVPQEFRAKVQLARNVLNREYPSFTPNIVRIDYKKDSIAFYDSPEFDSVNEPAAGTMITVTDDLVSKPRKVSQIWHHKWLWVDNSYTGFNVKDSIKRSEEWLATDTAEDPLPYRGIGSRKTWNEWLAKKGLQ